MSAAIVTSGTLVGGLFVGALIAFVFGIPMIAAVVIAFRRPINWGRES